MAQKIDYDKTTRWNILTNEKSLIISKIITIMKSQGISIIIAILGTSLQMSRLIIIIICLSFVKNTALMLLITHRWTIVQM